MNKNAKIKNIKLQIEKLQKEIKQLEGNDIPKFKVIWYDTEFGMRHVTTIKAKTAAAATRLFKTRKLHVVKIDGDQNCGPEKMLVGYDIIYTKRVNTCGTMPVRYGYKKDDGWVYDGERGGC